MSHYPRLVRCGLGEDVYRILKAKILSEQLTPGKRLDLRVIEKQMGISRTPLKEALNRLAVDGLVEIRPRSGTYVTVLSLEEIGEVFDARQVLEVYATGLAADRMTETELCQVRDRVAELRELMSAKDIRVTHQAYIELDYDLHGQIVRCGGNKQIAKLWERVNAHVQMARIHYRGIRREFDVAQQEHEAILSALEARDGAAARDSVRRHIERAKESLRREMDVQTNDSQWT